MNHVLIVEDREANRKLLKMRLEANGYRVTAAGDGLEALAAARRDPPDAIVSDVLMPKMDGFALCRAWMQDAELRAIPFIFYSATYLRRADKQFGLALGAVRYLIKPLDAEVFLAELRTVLQQRAGHAAPAPASPLNDTAAQALHELALERKLEDKIGQLEAANRKLEESEARFRSLTEMSSDFYWESDAEHRLTQRASADKKLSTVSVFRQGAQIGERRWDIPYLSPDAAGWAAHRAVLDAHEPFREFELSRLGIDGTEHFISISGDPMFDESGAFEGYRGVGKDITEQVRRIDDLRRLRAAIDATADAIYLVDRTSMRFIYVNDAACRMQGCTREELLALGPDGVLSASRAELEHIYDSIIAGGAGTEPIEMPRQRKDGSRVWVELRRRAQRLSEGWMIVTVVRDVTKRKAAESRIVHLNRVYAMLSGINTLIVHVRDRDELFREACQIAVEEGGFRMAWMGIVDRSVMKIAPVASAGMDEEFLTVIKDGISSSEGVPLGNSMIAQTIREKKAVVSNDSQNDPKVVFRKKHAESGIRSMAMLPLIVSDEAVGVLALFSEEAGFFDEEELELLAELASDIAFAIDHIKKEKKLNYLAYYDELTGLANRSLFLERVAQYMRSTVSGGHELALFLIDLERFKNINDSLGRPAGDALLRQVADWLTRNVRDANLLARVGADHFALVMPQVKQGGDLARLVEKWMAAFLEHPFRLDDAVFRLAVKAGVALFPDDGADAETLFRNAEAALKKAKAGGERYLFYTQKMTASVARKLTLENQLRQALDQEEFVLHYQPKVNLVSGKLTGAEALIRWDDPRTGLVPPGRFIPILEETGLIYDVGRWALRQAIKDYLRWRAAGLAAVRIAVNVSPLQLRNRGFVDEIRQAIGIDPQAAAGLELEITESLIMEDVKHNIASLQAIRALGVTIAIDDFGTGFSSLSYLAKLPVDTLKIDQLFVTDMTAGPQGLALVSTIISLAHSLTLTAVAEGVETEKQSSLLRLLACDEMQGFLYSRPVPGEIFETRFLAPPPAG
jgi:diguanylate cyclase (GGDEF)-like protein/PAS domain S-box-containing protein